MQELLIGAGILSLIGGLALAQRYLQNDFFLGTGLGLLAFGLLIGVPAGFWYHVRLWKALRNRMVLPRYWWLFPGGLREHLDEAGWKAVRPWLYAGGAGFLAAVAGIVLAAVGLFLS